MLTKNTFKKIKHSFGRFVSLVVIILIGVGFYAGIRQSTPAIRDAQNAYIKDANMMDLHIVSTLGFTDEDVEALKTIKGVDRVTYGYSEYVYSKDEVIRVISADNVINRANLDEGTRPAKSDECLGDSRKYKVGDEVSIVEPSGDENDDSEEKLSVHKFKVVGTTISPLYVGDDLGNTNIGNGDLESYIIVTKAAFNMDVYSDIYITVKKTDEDVAYSKSYEEKVDKVKGLIGDIQEERQDAAEEEIYKRARQIAYNEVEERREEIRAEVRAQVEEEVRKEIEDKQAAQEAELREKAGALGETFEEFMVGLNSKAQSVMSPLTDEQIDQLVDEQMDDAMAEAIDKAKDEAAAQVEVPECKWYIETRNDVIASYKTLKEQYTEVESIADIIPVFFIVIVILMTSNTMSRLIAEERGEMGTLASLGYSNIRIIGTYMIYVITATLIGAVGGYFLGVWLLPGFVFDCFPLNVPGIEFYINWKILIGSTAVAFVVMTAVTVFSCMKELRLKPAYLLRPVPPKRGRRLLLEKIKPVWNRMSFSWKITIRNLFRYKRRVLMTIVGVGGCTFLMFIGYALRDCISTVGDKQYSDIIHYDTMAIMNENVGSFDRVKEENDEVDKLLKDPLMMRQESLKVENSDNHSLDIYLLVPDAKSELFDDYFTLRAADPRDIGVEDSEEIEKGTPLELGNDGVIITPRIANVMQAGIGDKITMVDSDGNSYEVTVQAVAENYVTNYVYMSESQYSKVFYKRAMYNSIVAKNGLGNADLLSKKLYDYDSFVSVVDVSKTKDKANAMVKGLDSVVLLLTIISSLLAFTVIYNLISISISERTREIATLKVLGFTHGETNGFVYRETIISSIVGIAVGLAIAPYLLQKVLDVIGVDNLVFLREFRTESYLYAAGLSLVFTLLMMFVTYVKLRRIDMIESLKSVD